MEAIFPLTTSFAIGSNRNSERLHLIREYLRSSAVPVFVAFVIFPYCELSAFFVVTSSPNNQFFRLIPAAATVAAAVSSIAESKNES